MVRKEDEDKIIEMMEKGKKGKYITLKVDRLIPIFKELYMKKELGDEEIITMIKNAKMGGPYYRAFSTIMHNLGWAYIDKRDDVFKVWCITNKAIEDIEGKRQEQTEEESEFQKLKKQYEDVLDRYMKEDVVHREPVNKKILISLKELYNGGLMEFVDYAVENYDEVQLYLQQLYENAYFTIHGDITEAKIVLCDFPDKTTFKIDLNNLNTNYLNKIVEFEANIIYASPIKAVLKKAVFRCKDCGHTISKILESPFDVVPDKRNCTKENCSGEMERVPDEEVYVDFQEIHVQPIMNLTEDNDNNREQIIYYENTEGVFSGNVKVLGIVKTLKRQKSKNIANNIEDIIVHAKHIEKVDNHSITLNEDDIKNIKTVAKHHNVISKLANALFSEIAGYETVKKAIFLQQIKAVKKDNKRYNSHILLITDPGVGKTKMLKKIGEMGGNAYINMPTSTGNSITAVAEKKNTLAGESFVIKAGTLARTRGTVCIDEIMAVSEANKYLLECMESQVMNIEKGGVKAKFPADNAILAACNPRLGKFDPNMTVIEQINLPKPILSRFDLIFAIKDENNEERDWEIAMQILKNNSDVKDIDVIEGVELTEDFIKKYIVYAQQLKPTMTDEANNLLGKAYVQMRQKIENITARQMEAMIRIAEQIAKAKLKDKVEEEDAREAVELMNKTLEAIATDPSTGKIDIGKITGDTYSEREKMSIVIRIIKEVSDKNGLANYDDIVSEAIKRAMTEEEVEETLEKLVKRGDIDEPRSGKYRML